MNWKPPIGNGCFADLVSSQKLEKVIPDARKGEVPVHLRPKQIYAHHGP